MAYNNNPKWNSCKKQANTISQNYYNPYAFVPLNSKVCFLDEREKYLLGQIQDVPFKEGLSGKIIVDFEAMTPFCVRSTSGQNVQIKSSYFVPGSSIKGMIRSVFEIVTFSNIRNGIANNRYSMRDLRNQVYELKSNNHPQKSGFLIQLNGNYYIQECNNQQYKYSDIEEEERIKGLKQSRTIEEKYNKLQSHIIEYEDGSFSMWFFSGFMNNKEHEYLFDIPNFDCKKIIPLEDDEYHDFLFIHEKENENISWEFWKRKLKNYDSIESIKEDQYRGIVPCFFRVKSKTREDKSSYKCVKDLGFAFLYRQPYDKTIHDFLPSEYQKDGIDLAQSVFGYVNGRDAIKGRIQFGNSFIKIASTAGPQTFVLGSPKPTYYPFYLEQNINGRLLTYYSNDTRISGYKRYLIHGKQKDGNVCSSKVTTTFVPLESGTKFSTTITFHNLRNYELGALIAAISFCNHKECYHSLGFAKPFGYGKIKVSDVKIDFATDYQVNKDTLYKSFIDYICKKCKFGNETLYLQGLKQLFLLASNEYSTLKEIRYPNMQRKEFETIKKDKVSLKNFSPLQ